jgi:hypothetical protein
MIHYNRHLCFY